MSEEALAYLIIGYLAGCGVTHDIHGHAAS